MLLPCGQLAPNQGFNNYLLSVVIGLGVPIPVTSVTPRDYRTGVTYQSLPPIAWILGQKDRNCTLAGVMARLSQLETSEPNLHFKSDYRQAWITLSFLRNGNTNAFVQASYVIYGCHPDFVWPNIVADRKSRLGAEYHLWYTSDDVLRPDVPQFVAPSILGGVTQQDELPAMATGSNPVPSTTSAALLPSRIAANGADLSTDLGLGTVGPIPTKERIV